MVLRKTKRAYTYFYKQNKNMKKTQLGQLLKN